MASTTVRTMEALRVKLSMVVWPGENRSARPVLTPLRSEFLTCGVLAASGNDDDVALARFVVRTSAHARLAVVGVGDVAEVAYLAVAQLNVAVDQDKPVGDVAEDECVGRGAADLTAADYGDTRRRPGCFGRRFGGVFWFGGHVGFGV